jgi:CheY-like chemotaxis protein
MNEPTIVMIVDDDPDIRETLRGILEEEGLQAIEAAHGQEALDLLRGASSLPHMILLDLGMPVMNGMVFREQQLADPRLAEIPVVIISAGGTSAVPVGVHVLAKPFRIEALFAILGR